MTHLGVNFHRIKVTILERLKSKAQNYISSGQRYDQSQGFRNTRTAKMFSDENENENYEGSPEGLNKRMKRIILHPGEDLNMAANKGAEPNSANKQKRNKVMVARHSKVYNSRCFGFMTRV